MTIVCAVALTTIIECGNQTAGSLYNCWSTKGKYRVSDWVGQVQVIKSATQTNEMNTHNGSRGGMGFVWTGGPRTNLPLVLQ